MGSHYCNNSPHALQTMPGGNYGVFLESLDIRLVLYTLLLRHDMLGITSF